MHWKYMLVHEVVILKLVYAYLDTILAGRRFD